MRRIIAVIILLALVLAPLETLGILRRGAEQAKEVAGSVEAQSFLDRMKDKLPQLSEQVKSFFSRLWPSLEVEVKSVE
ncbi:MAG: hypothetical protein UY40_C0008G0013 [candidate division CPR1 bacterium GW2011_GWC1_49_13]|uniref:Uncharacterized protein n=1 Tax=candidate division CPR1 bacterium GW2011_GWC1_49_13 TaxID=1618342 RepID=A0A0G1VH83_9BACT|nr:MAG: hypothetical protein UY40_C0008G0013 [candidate division CPR1 bacterium GW2011_GWC1_49_13]